MTRYRSYHGGTATTMAATGDFRRHFAEAGTSGFVKIVDPTPFGFSWGDDEATACARALGALREQILMEGPETIACMLLEAVPGAAGVLLPPKGYMEGVAALCKEHGILLIADEVMTGFGRSGEMFGFQHYAIQPDTVCKSNLQPDFNVRVCECFDTRTSAVLRELAESNRIVQKSAESTSI